MRKFGSGSCLSIASLVLLGALVPSLEAGRAKQAEEGMPASPVRYTKAKRHPVRRTIVLPGSVASRTESLVASEVEGLVIELAAREGTAVRKGQAIVRLRSDQLELRLVAAEADLREAEARLTLAESNLTRSQELFESQVLSKGQLDDSQSEFNAWQGRAERLKAEIASIKLDVERSTIRAPFAGVVVAERCAVGEWIDRGDPVAELISLYDLEIQVDVPERYFGTIHVVTRHPWGLGRFPQGQYKRHWELQCAAEQQPGLSLADVCGTHIEATLRRARAGVERMERE